MGVAEGYAYHIKDDYFKLAQDGMLMKNKEGNNLRPTFFCLRDPRTSLLWMVPMSTQVEKYNAIAKKVLSDMDGARPLCLGILRETQMHSCCKICFL